MYVEMYDRRPQRHLLKITVTNVKRINLTPLPVPSYRHSYRLGIVIQFVRENSQSIEPHCFGDMNIPQLKEKLDNLSPICL